MKIHLRQKPISKNRKSLYLEFYESGKRQFEMLGLYIHDKKRLNQIEKDHNKQMLNTAEAIQSKRILEYKNNEYGFLNKQTDKSFLKYYQLSAQKSNFHLAAYKVFKIFLDNKDVLFSEINTKLLNEYKGYLQKKYADKTVNIYLTSISSIVKKAIKEGIYNNSPIYDFQNIKVKSRKRTYLTLDELKKMNDTDFEKDIKNPFLFACYCGLRVSDIRALKYKDIINNQIEIYQKKTREVVYIPINVNAYEYLDKNKIGSNEFVFTFRSSYYTNEKLNKWAKKAGIDKYITFHVARHTFATLSLTFGVDLYTVSKLLGHSNISTTQIYAKITDQLKTEAINKLPKL